MVDFTFVRYANVWEDPLCLLGGLKTGPGAKIASIASAGDNVLSLASTGADLVLAFDLSAPQLSVLELRMRAVQTLSRDELLIFMGYRALDNPRVTESVRSELWGSVKEGLSSATRQIYEANPLWKKKGVIHCGKFENYFKIFRQWVWPLMLKGKTRRQLLLPRSPQEREIFFDEKVNTSRWRFWFRMFFSKTVMGPLGRDPAFFKYVQEKVAPGLLARTRHALTALDPRENPFLEFILTGKFDVNLPHWLLPENYPKVKENLGAIKLHQGSFLDVLETYPGVFQGYNLSDLFEYLDEGSFRQHLELIAPNSPTGSRLAYWNMMVPRRGSEVLPQKLRYLEPLSRELFQADRAFFYQDFRVEEVL